MDTFNTNTDKFKKLRRMSVSLQCMVIWEHGKTIAYTGTT